MSYLQESWEEMIKEVEDKLAICVKALKEIRASDEGFTEISDIVDETLQKIKEL